LVHRFAEDVDDRKEERMNVSFAQTLEVFLSTWFLRMQKNTYTSIYVC
jgi:hypothetical protein